MNEKGLISKNTSLFLRGIAILMVCMSHYFAAAEESGLISSSTVVSIISALGDSGVGIFFFLSGYALYKGYGSAKTDRKFLINRFKNTYFPYVVIQLVILLLSGGIDGPMRIGRLLLGLDSWFIVTILIFYLVFYLVGKLPKYRLIIMCIFVTGMSLFLIRMHYPEFWYDADWCFPVGMILAKYEHKIGFVARGFSLDIKDYLMKFLGKNSLYIFLLHLFIYHKFTNWGPVLDSGMNWYIKMILAFMITVLMASVLNWLFNKIYKHTKIDRLKG